MNLSIIDWTILVIAVIAIRIVSVSTRSYVKGVADFLSANRTAGRYLLTIAMQMGMSGAISVVAMFEMYYQVGFSSIWWGTMLIPVNIIILLTGWVFYRFRETRAMTMAQFFEMRYGRRFRIFAGSLCWVSGVLNFGIFPAVTAWFFIYYCGLPLHIHIPGLDATISTFALVMAVDLGLALTFVNMGGQVSVMVTECFQGIFCSIAFVIISATVLLQLQWPSIISALKMAPENASMLHPFHINQAKDFNIWYFFIAAFGAVYSYNSWQGHQGFYSSARTPHEQKMGGIIGMWRDIPKALMLVLLPVAAYAVLHLPEFAGKAALINAELGKISNESIRNQMLVPVALANFLPVGVKGLLATTMLFFSFTCHDTYLHSWGSIFVQDIYMPIRNKPLDPSHHIRIIRYAIIGVAVFAFVFSLLYTQSEKILMYMAITGTIWLGGSGAVIIGGLYWRRGTTAGAYSALILGAIMGVSGLLLPSYYKVHFHREFPINGQWLWLIAMFGSTLIYVIVSLLTGGVKRQFDLNRILHRGKYSMTNELNAAIVSDTIWLRLVGITHEFSPGDRILASFLFIWNIGWLLFFGVVTSINLISPMGIDWWAKCWHFYVLLYLAIGIPSTIWFSVGGIMDVRAMLRSLATDVRDHSDDGRVVEEPDAVELSAGVEARPENEKLSIDN